ncbi:hypothetical protein E5676_scaffold419G00720 [Cucumis melo var. makuwa]|uniref:Uncharacterized protein n=1 Tax=Cucumis melo var. makuwa TaxID=1194695 RepID=A0A5D3DK04_CUCMM|nr:hypothetical protein E5676_scaffold419G00720 [Cucumis melo var. makuwa]
MLTMNQLGKVQKDRLVELEEQMLYLVEVSDSICFLESRLEESFEKVDTIDVVDDRVEGSLGSVVYIEERVNELDSSQKTLLEMINDMSKDFLAILDVVRNKITDVNTRLNLTIESQDVRRHQSSSPGRNRNCRSSSSKAAGGDKHPGGDRRPYQ